LKINLKVTFRRLHNLVNRKQAFGKQIAGHVGQIKVWFFPNVPVTLHQVFSSTLKIHQIDWSKLDHELQYLRYKLIQMLVVATYGENQRVFVRCPQVLQVKL